MPPTNISATVTVAVTAFLLIVNVSVHVTLEYRSVAGNVALTVYSPAAEGTVVE